MTVGLRLVDREKYAEYRAEMAPLLAEAGGRFRYDFDVSQTLLSESGHDLDRVFVIQFPDRAAKEGFFARPEYVEIRRRLFEKAVGRMEIIAEYAN
jgi:uncharacterized protein (DUF1330 family)